MTKEEVGLEEREGAAPRERSLQNQLSRLMGTHEDQGADLTKVLCVYAWAEKFDALVGLLRVGAKAVPASFAYF